MRVNLVSSNNKLTSLTSSGKQTFIDLAVQAWNEAVDQLYSLSEIMMPKQGAEDQITLVSGTRSYGLADDLIQIRWPLQNETDGDYIYEFKGGYEKLRHIEPQPANYTGEPCFAAISPIDKQLYLDYIPTSSEAGDVYKYLYWRDTVLQYANDVFPFDDSVFRAMVPVVAEIYRLMRQNKYVSGMVDKSFGRAIRMVKSTPQDTKYINRDGGYTAGPLGWDPYIGT